MNDIQTLLILIVQTPGMPLKIGAMIATAMLIGFILYDNTPNMFFRATVIFGVFFIFVEWIRISIVSQVAPATHPNSLVTTVSIFLGAMFLIGLFTGMGFAHRYRQKIMKIDIAADDVVEKIRNGDFGTSRIHIKLTNQETRPVPDRKEQEG